MNSDGVSTRKYSLSQEARRGLHTASLSSVPNDIVFFCHNRQRGGFLSNASPKAESSCGGAAFHQCPYLQRSKASCATVPKSFFTARDLRLRREPQQRLPPSTPRGRFKENETSCQPTADLWGCSGEGAVKNFAAVLCLEVQKPLPACVPRALPKMPRSHPPSRSTSPIGR